MKNINQISSKLLTLLFLITMSSAFGQDLKIVELDEVSIEYYDTQGEKTPLVFIHGDSRDGTQYDNFKSNFEESHRIITYSRRGYGRSKAINDKKGIATDVADLLNLLTFLKIDKAVFIGNSYAGFMMTYLAENHPEINIGQIYLAGSPGFNQKQILESDSLDSYKMMFWAQGGEDYANNTVELTASYQPEYIIKEKEIANIPALGFLNNDNMRGIENMNIILMYASAPDRIEYKEPKKFFQKVASDEETKQQVEDYFTNTVRPLLIEDSEKWIEYFSSLQVVNLDKPVVTGYEFESEPELVIKPIKDFLDNLNN